MFQQFGSSDELMTAQTMLLTLSINQSIVFNLILTSFIVDVQ